MGLKLLEGSDAVKMKKIHKYRIFMTLTVKSV